MPSIVALIPARSGSKRVPNKNIKKLGEHPLIAYTIQVALDAGIFSKVVVSTDSPEISEIAKYYGAEMPFLRPKEFSGDNSPDIEWIKNLLEKLNNKGNYDCFSILRPTSPFRTKEMIQRSWRDFISVKNIDSLRAVEKCSQHPGKMWKIDKELMLPLLKNPIMKGIEYHSSPYQSLPAIYAQNASLEIAWCRIPQETNSISGKKIKPFITGGFEGYDINNEKDWVYAEYLIKIKRVKLPSIYKKPIALII